MEILIVIFIIVSVLISSANKKRARQKKENDSAPEWLEEKMPVFDWEKELPVEPVSPVQQQAPVTPPAQPAPGEPPAGGYGFYDGQDDSLPDVPKPGTRSQISTEGRTAYGASVFPDRAASAVYFGEGATPSQTFAGKYVGAHPNVHKGPECVDETIGLEELADVIREKRDAVQQHGPRINTSRKAVMQAIILGEAIATPKCKDWLEANGWERIRS